MDRLDAATEHAVRSGISLDLWLRSGERGDRIGEPTAAIGLGEGVWRRDGEAHGELGRHLLAWHHARLDAQTRRMADRPAAVRCRVGEELVRAAVLDQAAQV